MTTLNSELNTALVLGSVVDERHHPCELKDMRFVRANMQLKIGNRTYILKFHLIPGITPKVKLIATKDEDYADFIKVFPYYYDNDGFTWLPLGYAAEAGYHKLHQMDIEQKKAHAFKSSILNLLYESALDALLNYFNQNQIAVFVLSPLSSGLWNIFYTGLIKQNLPVSVNDPNDSTKYIETGEYVCSEDVYCDVNLGRAKGNSAQEAINNLITAFMKADRPITIPENYQIHKYGSIERRLSTHI